MKIVIAIALVAVVLGSHPISHKLTEEINNSKTTWKAMTPEENPFSYMSTEEIKAMMGTKMMSMPEIKSKFQAYQLEADLPENWEFIEDFPTCQHPIRDQAKCGSCWAFGASESLSDRFCKAGVDVILSPEEMVECDKYDQGCNGGFMAVAWRFLASHGISTDECYPYHSGDGTVEKCHTTCEDGSEMKEYKCAADSIVHPKSIEDIKRELYTNGPMEVAFTVYEDFMSYKEGVYQHTTGKQLGGHAIKLVGWGVEDGVEYWKCANSWNTSWGMEGYFKIKHGDCGIEGQAYSCTPQL